MTTTKTIPPKTAHEIYGILEEFGVPSNRTLDCANKLIKPYSVLLDYAVKIGYKVDNQKKNERTISFFSWMRVWV